MSAPRWSRRPPLSNWGDFGADDQLGRLNLITPASVRRGLAEVRDGQSLCLSLPLDLPGGNVLNPRRHPPALQPTWRNGEAVYNLPIGDAGQGQTDVLSDDAVLLYSQYSTQWDGFGHVGHLFDVDGTGVPEPVYYNGFRAGADLLGPDPASGRFAGARRLGIDAFAAKAIQSRGVLVNLRQRVGDDRVAVGYDTLMPALDEAGVGIEPGDILCLYTGFADHLLAMNGQPDPAMLHGCGAVLDGRDERLRQWLIDCGIAALVADNYAVEALPGDGSGASGAAHGARLPLHELCLFLQGIALGELWYFGELVERLRDRPRQAFLLTAPPLRLPGAVGSPVTPVATI